MGKQKIISFIENIAKKVSAADQLAFPIINTLKRIISIVKRGTNDANTEKTNDLTVLASSNRTGANQEDEQVEDSIMDLLDEMMMDFDSKNSQISDLLMSHLNVHDETILTFGYSSTLVDCFRDAVKANK